jgi:glycosyltransferase involved in cell wall biosynthesis
VRTIQGVPPSGRDAAKKVKKKRIVIASVLKPADDVRAFEKMGLTLAAAGHQVYLIGMPASAQTTPANIRFMELTPFHRLHWKRLLVAFKVLKILSKVKPEVLIVNTHELLFVTFLNRIFFGVKIVYDIQENYYRNIRRTTAFPAATRIPLAAWVRFKERLFTPFFNRLILAEKCYRDELGFVSSNALVIENKAVLPPGFQRRPEQGKLLLAFTGTLGESTGIFQAIDLADKLYQNRPDLELHITGYCSIPEVLAEIINRCTGKKYIKLTAGKMQVGHEQILDLISRAHFGIISYPPSSHTSGRIPTKLFEYLSARLPILLQGNPSWVALAEGASGAIVVDFKNPDIDSLLHEMTQRTFYAGPAPVDEFLWKSQEPDLVKLVESL